MVEVVLAKRISIRFSLKSLYSTHSSRSVPNKEAQAND